MAHRPQAGDEEDPAAALVDGPDSAAGRPTAAADSALPCAAPCGSGSAPVSACAPASATHTPSEVHIPSAPSFGCCPVLHAPWLTGWTKCTSKHGWRDGTERTWRGMLTTAGAV